MSKVQFFEKTGCGGNARQKAMLESEGYELEVKSLLDYPWTEAELRPFFGSRPVAAWFNDKAPAVKSGEVVPSSFNEESALEIMIESPILIRRPLIAYQGKMACGFDDTVLEELFGLSTEKKNYEQCQHSVSECKK